MSTRLRDRRTQWDPFLLALVGFPAVGAVTTLVLSAYLTTWELTTESVGSVVFAVVFTVWSLSPFATAGFVGVLVQRHWRRGRAVALAGVLVLLAFTVFASWSVLTSESSTAVLALLFAPFVQLAIVGVTMGAAVGVAKLRRRPTIRAV